MTAAGLSEVRFVPARLPPHRPPTVAPEALRLRMLEAALAGFPAFVLDQRELHRAGPSYMVDTLVSLRAEMPTRPLCLMLGMDAFAGLPAWHRWREIPELAHVVVGCRPGAPARAGGEAGALLAEREVTGAEALARRPAGLVLVRDITQLDISSSAIRTLVAAGGSPRYLVPDGVLELMERTHIYNYPKEVRTRAQ
jgi:nicotinate-nucleotide adenylyltransferase